MSKILKSVEYYYNKVIRIDRKYMDKSEEYYFGENNPLKTRMIANITHIREIVKDAKMIKPNISPKECIKHLKPAVDELRKTIIEEFNIEGCSIGWMGCTNAACYTQISNSDLYGEEDLEKQNRINLDDIIKTDSTGFHYKNPKGIYYAIVIGWNIFASDELFTVEEAAGVLMHELGHGMQHIVNSLNETVAISYFKYIYSNYWALAESMSSDDFKEVDDNMKRLKKAIKNGDKETLKKLGEEFLNKQRKKDGISFKDYSDDDVTSDNVNFGDLNRDNSKNEKKVLDNNNKFSIFKFIGGLLKGILSVAFSPLWIISAIYINRRYRDKNNDEHLYKLFEETADNFCQIYGLGPQQASALRKLSKYSDLSISRNIVTKNLFERIPLLDSLWSMEEVQDDAMSCAMGYPTNYQRAINLYKSAAFELKNNKDLSPEAKAEIEKQIEFYKGLYEDIKKDEKKKGWLYKILAGTSRLTLEEAAKKDKWLDEQVLIPLQQKADPNFKPEEE